MGLEAVLPGPQNALYVMLCYVTRQFKTPLTPVCGGAEAFVTETETNTSTLCGTVDCERVYSLTMHLYLYLCNALVLQCAF